MTNPSPLIMAVAVLLGSIATPLVPDTPQGDPRGVSEIGEPMYSTTFLFTWVSALLRASS